MAVIKQDDLIQSVADALQFISYYHPVDFIQAMHEAYLREESPAARDSMAQILINSRMCATGHRPICQDTGIVTVFVRVGMDVRWDGATMSVDDMINEGVRRAYNLPENVLRASILADPAGARKNTKDNTPAVIHYSIVPGDKVEVDVAAKGGGSENKSKMAMLNPSDSIVDWVLKTVPTMGAGWCPPGMLGIGIGGTAEKAAVMAKEVLMDPIDIHELKARGPQNRIEELRLELFEKVNQLGIGAQGLGGLMSLTGRADNEEGAGPVKVGVALTDILTGLYSSTAVLAALAHRDVSGIGQHIDMALLDVQVACLANQTLNYLTTGVPPRRLGNAHPNIVPYQDFPTADGDMILTVGNDSQFRKFAELADHPEWADDPRFATNKARVANREVLIPLIRQATVLHTTAEWILSLERAGVPCGPINDLAQVFADPQVQARGLRVELPHPLAGTVPQVASPIRLSETPVEYRNPPPTLGQHTDEVLETLLGLDAAALERLRDGKVI